MFCAPVHIFGGTEGVGSRLHVLRARTCFRRYQGRGVPFSCFALPDLFSTVPRASSPVFMFCPPGLVFSGTEGVGSRFHVLPSRTRFRRYRGRQVRFSCFKLPDSFWAVPRASGPVFLFCVSGIIFCGNEGVRSRFHVLPSQTRFWRYRGRRVPFLCFARPDSFSAVPRVSGRNQGRRVPFSCFARPDSFSAEPRATGPVFMFCPPVLVFGGTEGIGSRFHVLLSQTLFQR
jgi:hypothetical protein